MSEWGQRAFRDMSDAELRALVDMRYRAIGAYGNLTTPLPPVTPSHVISNGDAAWAELQRRATTSTTPSASE